MTVAVRAQRRHRTVFFSGELTRNFDCEAALMRALWHKLPVKWQHCIGVFVAVLIFTLPIFLLALDNKCIQLTGRCH